MKIIEVYNNIKNRIKSESPKLFKKLRKISIRIVIASIAVITTNASLSLALSPIIITILSYIIAVGVAVFGTSILTIKEDSK